MHRTGQDAAFGARQPRQRARCVSPKRRQRASLSAEHGQRRLADAPRLRFAEVPGRSRAARVQTRSPSRPPLGRMLPRQRLVQEGAVPGQRACRNSSTATAAPASR